MASENSLRILRPMRKHATGERTILMMTELETKLALLRQTMTEHGLGGIRLRGMDWFAWATGGGSSAVLLTTDVGIAEIWVTADQAWVLTDSIEAGRLAEEELGPELSLWAGAWAHPAEREAFVAAHRGPGPVASDRPGRDEISLPEALVQARSRLLPDEQERYRALGRDAAEAATDVLRRARPEWSGLQLAGAAAEALWTRGIHPALTLVGDERRLPRFRHATPSRERLGARAMLVLCARRHGLFANLTRFVYFRAPTTAERDLARDVAAVESAALSASKPGASLEDIYDVMVEQYRRLGHPGAEALHHQGGACGYLARDAVARPGLRIRFQDGDAAAWNPSLPGAKIEDTFLVTSRGVELLTLDSRWPTFTLDGRQRPDLLQVT